MNKRNIQNNLCECYHEQLGYSVWVQSDEAGLWFNLNDILETFGLGKKEKRRIVKLDIQEENKIQVTFNRNNDNEEYTETFVSESVVHEIIAINKKETFQAESFIYDIIVDYDTTCVNLNQQKLNTTQRIALQALRNEAKHHEEVTKHYMKMLKDNTNIPEKFEEYKNEINKEVEEMKTYKPSYDTTLTPNEVKINGVINDKQERLQKSYEKLKGSNLEKAVNNLQYLNEKYTELQRNEYENKLKEKYPDDYRGGGEYIEMDWDDALTVISETVKLFEELDNDEITDEDIIELNWDDIL